MFRWALNRASEAAALLGVDDELLEQWREVAAHIAPYPTWNRAEGKVLAEMPNLEPIRLPGDHFGDAAAYPALLADEINLDSPKSQREMMIRSVQMLPSGSTAPTLLLLGVALDNSGGRNLFPVATQEKELAFRNFQARGGFLVSACRNADGICYVEIHSRRDQQCQVMNPWPAKKAVVWEAGHAKPVPVQLDMSNGECLVFSALSGHTYRLQHEANEGV
jgi:hypothetical protein